VTPPHPDATSSRHRTAITALTLAIIAAAYALTLSIMVGVSHSPGNEDLGWVALRVLLDGIVPFLIAILLTLVLGIVAVRSGNASSKRFGKVAFVISAISVVILIASCL
jgi:hypothetical protein